MHVFFIVQENERQLAAKEASLPQEPTPDDVNAVTLLVRMPDGSRRGRRFLKSDKLQVSWSKYINSPCAKISMLDADMFSHLDLYLLFKNLFTLRESFETIIRF